MLPVAVRVPVVSGAGCGPNDSVMLTHAFGFLGAALSMSIAWPQVYRSCVRRRTSGLSATACMLSVAMPLGWVTYGLLIGDRFQVVTNTVSTLTGLAILIALLVTRPALRAGRALLTSAGAAAGVLCALLGTAASAALPQVSGPRAAAMLGTVLAAVSFVSAVPQPLALLRDRTQDVSGLSPVRWTLAASACGSWLVYGLGVGQPAVWASALVGLVSALIVCGVLLVRRTGSRALATA
ncbi:SemiSWEET transporter [Actinoplanes sp. NPDC049802]|uniref:SemiSWEET transporter n=1 Tax=Actinoplanes sp. NPDC049802 TaxID=3154742 RepID=UPI003411ABA8